MPARTPADLQAFVLADPLCRELAALGREHGRPIALVGGWVRDWLLGRPALDWDLVLPGDPRPVVEAYARRIKGPVVVLDPEMGVYRTRLRSGLVLDFTRQQGEALATDLARRDMTINALACDLASGRVIDPTGGLADMAAGRIRVISRANMEDDPLRMLRVYRFAATLGYAVEPETAAWVAELAPTIARSAGERILAELGKLLPSPRGPEALAAAEQVGLLGRLFPELDQAARQAGLSTARALVEAVGALETDMGEPGRRTAAAIAQTLAGDRPVRGLMTLAALLVPIGDRPEAIEAVASRLRWSNKEDAWVRTIAIAPRAAFEAAEAAHVERAVYHLARAHQAVTLGLVVTAMARGLPPKAAERLLAIYWALHDRRAAAPRLLTGHDLIRELALPPGPQLGRILDRLDEAQALGEVATREEALACAASLAAEGE